MTCAIAKAILLWDAEGRLSYERLSELTIEWMRELGTAYPDSGYGSHFRQWLFDKRMGPYKSCGNGSAMRVSPVGWAAESLEECIKMSNAVTQVTHDHPDGIKGAQATATQIFFARRGHTIERLKTFEQEYYYPIEHELQWFRKHYRWSSLCDNTCQPAYVCFYESTSYEDCIRNCMSIGGDSDTIGAIAGGIAEAYHHIPDKIRTTGILYLDEFLTGIYEDFSNRFIKE
jgi:type I restriction enzyme M protein